MSELDPLVGPLRAGVSTVELDGRVCAYSPTTQQVQVLNETASAVLLLADGTRTAGQLVVEVARAYSAAPDDVDADVRAALASFVEAGLIDEPVSPPSDPAVDPGA